MSSPPCSFAALLVALFAALGPAVAALPLCGFVRRPVLRLPLAACHRQRRRLLIARTMRAQDYIFKFTADSADGYTLLDSVVDACMLALAVSPYQIGRVCVGE